MSVGARTDNHLVDNHFADFVERLGVFGQVRESYRRFDLAQINFVRFVVDCVLVRLIHDVRAFRSALHVVNRLFIYFENTVFRARLDCHVRNRESIVNGERFHALADEFHGLIQRAVHADFADNMQDDVLARHVFIQLAFKHEFNRGRHFEPSLTRRHTARHIRRAYARGERADCAVRTRMRVRADNDVPRHYQALFGEQGVFDTHTTYVVEMGYLVFVTKVAAHFALYRRLDVFVGGKVVHDHRYFILIEYLFRADTVEFAYRYGRSNVVAEHSIHVHEHELPCLYFIQPCVRRKDFLRHCHCHCRLSFLRFIFD